MAHKYLKTETNSSQSSSVESSSSSVPEIIPSHQVPRIHSKNDENNFLNCLQDPIDQTITENDQLLESLEQELDLYENKSFNFNENSSSSKFRALEYFRIFKKDYQVLIKIVKIIFSVTASSVPSENLFSDAGQIQNEMRYRLHPSVLNLINFIKSTFFP